MIDVNFCCFNRTLSMLGRRREAWWGRDFSFSLDRTSGRMSSKVKERLIANAEARSFPPASSVPLEDQRLMPAIEYHLNLPFLADQSKSSSNHIIVHEPSHSYDVEDLST